MNKISIRLSDATMRNILTLIAAGEGIVVDLDKALQVAEPSNPAVAQAVSQVVTDTDIDGAARKIEDFLNANPNEGGVASFDLLRDKVNRDWTNDFLADVVAQHPDTFRSAKVKPSAQYPTRHRPGLALL